MDFFSEVAALPACALAARQRNYDVLQFACTDIGYATMMIAYQMLVRIVSTEFEYIYIYILYI
jgi:hypothetical protein